jgi:mRNA-degrading endonuclease RelE of RelBE toxin-antitoxin system
VSPKRGDRVAPPAAPGAWELRFASNEAVKGWDALCQHAPGNTYSAWQDMRTNPRPPVDSRHARLRGDYGTKLIHGRALEQWQIEVTSGARIWYAIDDDRRTVWITHAATRHPKATE